VQWVRALYRWLTAKEWEQHRSHEGIYVPPDTTPDNPFDPLSKHEKMMRSAARGLPFLGDTLAARAAKHFPSIRKMVNAGPTEWQEIDGFGAVNSEKLVKALEEE
jgi:hypothetical protein